MLRLCVIAVVLALFACSSETKSTAPTVTTDPISVSPVKLSWSVDYTFESNSDTKAIAISRATTQCQGTTPSTRLDTLWAFQYQLVKGQLYLWDSLQCTSLRFHGGNTSVLGSWEFDDTAAYPVQYWETRVSPSCEKVVPSRWTGATLKLSASKATVSMVSDSFCLVTDALVFRDLAKTGFQGATVTKKDCKTMTLTLGDKVATLEVKTMDLGSNARSYLFTYGGKTCSQDIAAPSATCTAASSDPSKSTSGAFALCVLGTGFSS